MEFSTLAVIVIYVAIYFAKHPKSELSWDYVQFKLNLSKLNLSLS